MQNMYYIGLDVHKKKISYCMKDGSGEIYADGSIPATRFDPDCWVKTLSQPWTAAMEVTIFTSWIYDRLLPHAGEASRAAALCRAAEGAREEGRRVEAARQG